MHSDSRTQFPVRILILGGSLFILLAEQLTNLSNGWGGSSREDAAASGPVPEVALQAMTLGHLTSPLQRGLDVAMPPRERKAQPNWALRGALAASLVLWFATGGAGDASDRIVEFAELYLPPAMASAISYGVGGLFAVLIGAVRLALAIATLGNAGLGSGSSSSSSSSSSTSSSSGGAPGTLPSLIESVGKWAGTHGYHAAFEREDGGSIGAKIYKNHSRNRGIQDHGQAPPCSFWSLLSEPEQRLCPRCWLPSRCTRVTIRQHTAR